MNSVPQELLLIIFAYGDTKSLMHMERICKKWRKIIKQTAWQVHFINSNKFSSNIVEMNRQIVIESCRQWYEIATEKEWNFVNFKKPKQQRLTLLASDALPRAIPYPRNIKIACLHNNHQNQQKMICRVKLQDWDCDKCIIRKHWVFLYGKTKQNKMELGMYDLTVMKLVGTAPMLVNCKEMQLVHDPAMQTQFFKKHPQVTRAAVFVLVVLTLDQFCHSYVLSEWEQDSKMHFTCELQSSCKIDGIYGYFQVYPHSQMTIVSNNLKYSILDNYSNKVVASLDSSAMVIDDRTTVWIEVAIGVFQILRVTNDRIFQYMYITQSNKFEKLSETVRYYSTTSSIRASPSGLYILVTHVYSSVFINDLPLPDSMHIVHPSASVQSCNTDISEVSVSGIQRHSGDYSICSTTKSFSSAQGLKKEHAPKCTQWKSWADPYGNIVFVACDIACKFFVFKYFCKA